MHSTPQPLVSKSPAQRSTGISILLVVTLFLQSHAGLADGDVVRDDPYDLFDATEYTNRTVAVRWETTDNVLARCNEESHEAGFCHRPATDSSLRPLEWWFLSHCYE